VRYFLRLAYDGRPFHGWQVQPNAVTVQQVLNESMAVLLKEPVETTGCGRTDTGVHATEFFAHFDVSSTVSDPERFIRSLNALLPPEVAVYDLLPVHPEAHARFDAVSRTYEYHLTTRKDPFLRDRALFHPQLLEVNRMNDAARLLLEHDDFACFNKSGGAQTGTVCKVSAAAWEVRPDRLVFTVTANRFLRNMVRAMVGTLLEVGEGRCSLDEFRAILISGDRSDAGMSVPAHGLFLVHVVYPYLSLTPRD
jgi:tRNA pseudouridine38-40 synthase